MDAAGKTERTRMRFQPALLDILPLYIALLVAFFAAFNVLEAMRAHGIKRIAFSSTGST